MLQDSEEIDDQYKTLDKLLEPALISLFGSELDIGQENKDENLLKLEFDDLCSVVVPFL